MEVDSCSSSKQSEIIQLLLSYGVGRRMIDDALFEEGNKWEKPLKKLGIYSTIAEEELHIKASVSCNVPSCHRQFDTIFGYESHYNFCHRHLCNECHKNLPSSHLLDMHLCEVHDSFFAVQSKTKPSFVCYLEECTSIFMTPQERNDHCYSVHKFPHNFRFDLKSKKKGKVAKVSSSAEHKMVETVEEENVTQLPTSDGSETAKKSYKVTSFGHSQVKSFNSDTNYAKVLTKNQPKRKSKSRILEDNKMVVDLMESLPE